MNPLNIISTLHKEFEGCEPSPLTPQEEDFAFAVKGFQTFSFLLN